MTSHAGVFDLGEIDVTRPSGGQVAAARPHAMPRGARPAQGDPRAGARALWPSVRATLTRVLPLLVPGIGQFLRCEMKLGVLFLSWLLLCGALAWSAIVSLNRLVATLSIFGCSAVGVFVFLAALYVLAGFVHLTSVLNAVEPRDPAAPRPHPSLACVASLLVPGWGQLISGHRVRAGVFLGVLWLLGGFWLFYSPEVTRLLNVFLPGVDPLEMALRQPAVQWTVCITIPALLWSLAVYDATASATWARRRPANELGPAGSRGHYSPAGLA